jgi:uncharacterized membrane protein YgaE (UPF0421/DUF939 family)
MLDKNERAAFLRLIQSDRRSTTQTFLFASLWTLQALSSAALLISGYAAFHARGVYWAIVSAILVLQPGIEQSIAASAVRIAANIVGGAIAFAVGRFCGVGAWQLLLGLALTVICCEILRLDLGLRTACVAAVIVLTANDGQVTTSSLERLSAVLIGCFLAVGIQLIVEGLRRALTRAAPPAAASPGASEPHTHSSE